MERALYTYCNRTQQLILVNTAVDNVQKKDAFLYGFPIVALVKFVIFTFKTRKSLKTFSAIIVNMRQQTDQI